MKKIFLLFLIIGVFVVFGFAQEQPINPNAPNPTPTPEITDDSIPEIDGYNLLPTPEIVTGKVVDVHDGDTITVLNEQKKQYKVRFNGIDAPELKQDFGNKSRQNLAGMVFGKTVTINCPKVDKYGRNVCTVFLEKTDINLEQVKGGFAWHYKKYQDEQTPEDRKNYSEAEINARNQKLGLWLQPNAIEPSAWRRGEGNPNTAGVPKGAIIGNKNSMIYHTPGCSTYAKVSPQNQAIFATEKEAIAKGYRMAGGCQSTLKAEERPKPSTTQTTRVYQIGSRGGCYYLSPSGKKNYVDKSYCQKL